MRRTYIGPNLGRGDGMGRNKAAGRDALIAAIKEAHRRLQATWAEAREDVRRFRATEGADELEAAINAYLRSQRKLVAAGERLRARLARHRRARRKAR